MALAFHWHPAESYPLPDRFSFSSVTVPVTCGSVPYILQSPAVLFNGYAALFQICDDVFKAFVFFADLFFRGIDDLIGQSQLGRNGESITFTGNTDEQTVGGAKGLHIKFTAGIFYKISGKCIDFSSL